MIAMISFIIFTGDDAKMMAKDDKANRGSL